MPLHHLQIYNERAPDKNGRPFTCWPSAVSYDQAMSNFAMRFHVEY